MPLPPRGLPSVAEPRLTPSADSSLVRHCGSEPQREHRNQFIPVNHSLRAPAPRLPLLPEPAPREALRVCVSSAML